MLKAAMNPRKVDGLRAISLYEAVSEGHQATVEKLLNLGADPQAKYANGLTPLACTRYPFYDSIVDLIEREEKAASSERDTLSR